MGTFVATRVAKKSKNIKPVARHIMALAKETRNRARVKNSTMRFAIQFDDKEPAYWVESAPGAHPVDPEKLYEKKSSSEDEKETRPLFSIEKGLTKKKIILPEGLYFASLETISMKAPIKEDIGYIHFFPEGMVEAAALQITDRKNLVWTLIFNPLTGQVDIVEEAKGLKDITR